MLVRNKVNREMKLFGIAESLIYQACSSDGIPEDQEVIYQKYVSLCKNEKIKYLELKKFNCLVSSLIERKFLKRV